LVLAIVFISVLVDSAEAVLSTLGIGVILIVAVVAWDIRLVLLKPQLTTAFARSLLGWHLLGAFFLGALALFRPTWSSAT
jgi:hypothetical protein